MANKKNKKNKKKMSGETKTVRKQNKKLLKTKRI